MYERLFSTERIGRAEIKNRVVMTPMGTVIAAPGGGVNDDIIAYYEARAKGGVGLIESELCRVLDGAGAAMTCQLAARNLADVAGLARLVDVVHKYGTKIFIQLHHPGGQGSSAIGGEPIVAASAVKSPAASSKNDLKCGFGTFPFGQVWKSRTGSASSGLPRWCLRCPSTCRRWI